MHRPSMEPYHPIPATSTSHPKDPIPLDPTSPREFSFSRESRLSISTTSHSTRSSVLSIVDESPFTSDGELPDTPRTEPQSGDDCGNTKGIDMLSKERISQSKRRASTKLISQGPEDFRRLLGKPKVCCGGGCCLTSSLEEEDPTTATSLPVMPPNNEAYQTLQLKLESLRLESRLTNVVDLPPQTVVLEKLEASEPQEPSTVKQHPPKFLKPHAPYDVFSAKVHNARELTKPGAEKRTYHFDLDVTDYPKESGNVDFVVGGAVGICAPNSEVLVDEVFDLLGIPSFVRDRQVMLKTSTGRWPTIWGDDQPRSLVTTRRELLTWCSDVQSYPPTKPLFRLLAEHASDPHEQKILLYLASAQGQATFCDLRNGPHITLAQLLSAFPSTKPPLPHLLSVLNTLMPRFYSLSQDPQLSCARQDSDCRRLIEIAVTVHETPNWRGGPRTGVGSGFLERTARQLNEAERNGISASSLDLRVPMFRGLMTNPLAREFNADGPMLLIGAGVGVAPFRGFVQRRLKSASCANKVWVLQGVRDSLLDELYSGEWGVHEEKVKKVVQSRKGRGKYVQEEVRAQADLVWFVINALDGRVFVCGSGKGMGEGVEAALTDVAIAKGGLNQQGAEEFWRAKKDSGQYISETW